ncbi:sensor histidine kinase [Deinococcus sp. AB2017081]|uniref:sensor histidine kinase n=1 Tax=Deinococcus sp. AB2017081 TaxID=3093660 RepID=UPI002ACBEEBE|nr:sensor histidine kinase [Deinococcus sp. AB2017081]WQE96453.1 sensor histidine kinase [Deinococcus sp. AB2017081]
MAPQLPETVSAAVAGGGTLMQVSVAARQRGVWAWFPLLWLAFLAYPLIGFFDHPRPAGEWLRFWAVLAGFVAVYARVFFVRPPEHAARWAVAGWAYALAAYFVLLPVIGGTATAFLIYGGSIIGFQARVAVALWLAFLNVAIMVVPFWDGRYALEDLAWLAPNMVFTLVAAYANHASYRRNVADARLVQVQAEKEKLAADAERERIARDLHDLLGHTLSVIVLKSELAGKLAERDPARAAAEIREVERISRDALSEVRSAVSGYRGSGLGAELARAKVALDTAGVKLSVTEALPTLPPRAEQAAAMLLREAITNVVRHAHARAVDVTLTPHGRGWRLVVHDDGIGGAGPEGSGLTGMRERLRAIGGTLERSGAGGTTLTATLPGEDRSTPETGLVTA